jgi:hypothetical protein
VMIWQMVAHLRLGPCMRMDWADKDCGEHEDAVHVQAKNGSGTVEGMVGIAGSAATCTAPPQLGGATGGNSCWLGGRSASGATAGYAGG